MLISLQDLVCVHLSFFRGTYIAMIIRTFFPIFSRKIYSLSFSIITANYPSCTLSRFIHANLYYVEDPQIRTNTLQHNHTGIKRCLYRCDVYSYNPHNPHQTNHHHCPHAPPPDCFSAAGRPGGCRPQRFAIVEAILQRRHRADGPLPPAQLSSSSDSLPHSTAACVPACSSTFLMLHPTPATTPKSRERRGGHFSLHLNSWSFNDLLPIRTHTTRNHLHIHCVYFTRKGQGNQVFQTHHKCIPVISRVLRRVLVQGRYLLV